MWSQGGAKPPAFNMHGWREAALGLRQAIETGWREAPLGLRQPILPKELAYEFAAVGMQSKQDGAKPLWG